MAFGDMPLCFDPRNLDKVTGEKSLFLWNPDSIVFYNYSRFSRVPELFDEANRVWHFSIEHPTKRWRRIIRNESGAIVSDMMVPYVYDVEYQKVCGCGTDLRDARGYKKTKHKFDIHFRGGIHLAPKSKSGQSGIIHIVNGTV